VHGRIRGRGRDGGVSLEGGHWGAHGTGIGRWRPRTEPARCSEKEHKW
jgi:hypothetical protein